MSFMAAVGTLGGIGLCFGVGLATAYRLLEVQKNPKEEALIEALPGINCGGCGFPGCSGYASALAKGEATPDKCLPGGKAVAASIGEILGIKVSVEEPKFPRVLCKGGGLLAKKKFLYEGVNDCNMAVIVGGGDKVCSYACLGMGSCVRACKFGAIKPDKKTSIPVVDINKCVSCGVCVSACPKYLIELCPPDKLVNILCSSNEPKGINVKKTCEYGCIKCRKCIKVCPVEAPHMVDNMVRIDMEKCTNCGECVKGCPTKVIEFIGQKVTCE